jgi:hexosaminidase
MFKIVVVLVAIFSCSSAINPGPVVHATKGEVWPKPQQQEKSQDFFVIRPHTFSFKAPDNIGCPNFLNDALTRYWTIIATATLKKSWTKQSLLDLDSSLGNLDSLTIELTGECASEEILPAFGDDENYSLTVSAEESLLSAATIWGVLRGLETFSQLIYTEQDVVSLVDRVVPFILHLTLVAARHQRD